MLILCLYYSKDLVNSLDNEPKFSIRLDLFKNDIGSNELKSISFITIKDSIKLDNTGINYLYPSLIHFKSKSELYIILKGNQYSEIYSVEINAKTLKLINPLLLNITKPYLESNNIEHISFCIREFIGSFYIVKYNSMSNNISVMIFGDRNKFNNFEDTIIQYNIDEITNNNIIKIETSSISNVLLGILFVTESNDYVIFIQYPMCDPSPIKYKLSITKNKEISIDNLIPSNIEADEYSKYFIYSNYIIDDISNSNSKLYGKIKSNDFTIIISDENYLEIKDLSTENKKVELQSYTHIKNLEIKYNIYYEDLSNKFYSTSCYFLVNICYPLSGNDDFCKNKDEMPILGHYINETEGLLKPCDESCEYCIGSSPYQCIKCNNSNEYLSETNLTKIEINSKIYEYSICILCNTNKYYINNNFENDSIKVCIDKSSICPEEYPYIIDDYEPYQCYKNCKDSGTEMIYGSPRSFRCEDECINNYYFYENNTCVEDYII